MEVLEKIETLKEQEKKHNLIYSPETKLKNSDSPNILSIYQDEENDLTRIDFIVYPSKMYQAGWWCQIDKDTFIRPLGTPTRLTLVKAVNIPIAPKMHFYRSINDYLCYTLYFPALPPNTKAIDIIEKDVYGGSWFNFYNVSLERIKTERLVVNSN
jgi:hypothetical protein